MVLAAADLGYNTTPCINGNRPQHVIERRPEPAYEALECLGRALYQLNTRKTTRPAQGQKSVAFIINGIPLSIEASESREAGRIQNSIDANQFSTLSGRLNLIKDRLGLSITQMAELFGVTRKSVYDWYEGVEPRSNTLGRIEILIDALDKAPARSDLTRLKSIWNISVSEASFRTVFNDTSMDISELRIALIEKLNELSSRMVAANISAPKKAAQIGDAHLAEIDRRADFG